MIAQSRFQNHALDTFNIHDRPKKKGKKKKKKIMHNALSSVGVSHFGRACVEIWGKLREGWGNCFVCDCIL